MNVIAYSIYLVLSVALTVWVARVLFMNGRIFLVDAFKQNTELADSINHLLVVGFYLVNMGWVLLAMVGADPLVSVEEVFMFLSVRLGVVLLILGGMHFFNLLVLSRIRRRSTMKTAGAPPVSPHGFMPPYRHAAPAGAGPVSPPVGR